MVRPVSVIAWIPIAILWFGLGDRPSWFLIALGSFFPIFTNTYDGARALSDIHIRVSQCFGAPRWLYLRQVLLPATLPHIMTGLRVGLGTGWTCVIAAELISTTSGLGYMIQLARTTIETQALSGQWLAKNGTEGTTRFLKAWIIATWWTSNNLDKAHAWFAQTSRLDANLLNVATDADRYLRAPVKDIKTLDFVIDDAEIADSQKVLDFLREQKLLTARIDAAAYYDRGPLDLAQKEIAAGRFPDLAKIQVAG